MQSKLVLLDAYLEEHGKVDSLGGMNFCKRCLVLLLRLCREPMNDSVCHCSFLVDPREGCSSTPSRAQATSGLMGHGSSRSLCTSCGMERRNHAPGIPSSIPLRAPRRSASRSTPGGARLEPRRDAPRASKADGIRPLAQAVRWPTFARPRIERERIPAVVGALSLLMGTRSQVFRPSNGAMRARSILPRRADVVVEGGGHSAKASSQS
jgi:hypothetical protein